MAERGGLPRACGVAGRAAQPRPGRSRDRQCLHAETGRCAARASNPGGASGHPADCDFGPVALRSLGQWRHGTGARRTAGPGEAAHARCSSRGSTRYHRRTTLSTQLTEMFSANDSSSPQTAVIRFQRLRLAVLVLGVLTLLAFAGASAYDAWRSYRHSLVATDREIGNMANALADQTAWSLQAVDLLLRDTASWYTRAIQEIPAERLDDVLATRTAGVHQGRLITIVDAQGLPRHRSRGSSPPHLDVSDRSYFIAQRDRTVTGVFMSEPIITRSENRPGFVLSRRIEDDQGRFAGVVTAIVDLEELKQFYGAINLGGGSAIHLLREDGTLLARNPPTPEAVGRKFPELAAVPVEPATRLVSPIDGQRDFIAVSPVTDTPLKP